MFLPPFVPGTYVQIVQYFASVSQDMHLPKNALFKCIFEKSNFALPILNATKSIHRLTQKLFCPKYECVLLSKYVIYLRTELAS